ncbi:GNAT family N-acetyltransferase [Flavobacterium sp. NRK1]|uniref:GNAT family N-acetyltransferase n=1 Tax=Flavobacterium sp. NRK1 TaxID=2954929 RepID=UPI002093F698|nr:GNAT family N-acetyltransferase [Flavobacterium sp. NRK1]MCO6148174.1 GNAT family N-acetyltransferase [Flavobacterium sp. NRK1]
MQTNPFQPFPILTSERLILRKISPDDDQSVYIQRSSPIVNKYIVRAPVNDITDAQAWILRINNNVNLGLSVNWAITLKDSGTFIGLICLWNFSEDRTIAETGYELSPAYHGKGYMNEALQCVMEYGFSKLNLKTITAYTHRENASSLNLLKKNGFIWDEGEVDEDFPYNVIYSISK